MMVRGSEDDVIPRMRDSKELKTFLSGMAVYFDHFFIIFDGE
jgi:hypothetical protein